MPFWRHGFLPEPLTLARFFVAWVPRCSAAFSWTTASQIRSVLITPPKISSLRSTEPTVSFFVLTMSIFMAHPAGSEDPAYFFPLAAGFLATVTLPAFSACTCGSFFAATALRTMM